MQEAIALLHNVRQPFLISRLWVTVRRVVLALSEACPFQALLQRAWTNLRELIVPNEPFQAPQPTPGSA